MYRIEIYPSGETIDLPNEASIGLMLGNIERGAHMFIYRETVGHPGEFHCLGCFFAGEVPK